MTDDPKKQPPPATRPGHSAPTPGTGEGANTALDALIRQRKMGHTPDEQRAGTAPAPATASTPAPAPAAAPAQDPC